jgi:hypothetical protein
MAEAGEEACVVQRASHMQFPVEPQDVGDFDVVASAENQHVDFAALRILATWIARRTGLDPETGATIDRGFVVAQAHA